MSELTHGTPERIALELTQTIASLENKDLYGHLDNPADREWLLTTYAQCIKTVRNAHYDKK